jgi:hypothetical protein
VIYFRTFILLLRNTMNTLAMIDRVLIKTRIADFLNKSEECMIWGFHSNDYEECRVLRCGTVWILKEPTFRRSVSLPSSG